MSEARRRWWMRTLAVVVGGGGTVTGAWVGFSREAVADQNAPLAQVSEQLNNAARPPAPEPFERPRDTSVVPVNAAVPPAPPAPEMGLQPPASLPLPPAPTSLPLPPAVPEVKPIIPAAAPFPPNEIPPLPTPSLPAPPKAQALPPVPTVETPKVPAAPLLPPDLGAPAVPAPIVPVVPVEPGKPTGLGSSPPKPGEVVPITNPVMPQIPAPTGLPLPPLPSKVPDPALPSLPAKPDSGLPNGNGGINVKTDKVGGSSGPVVPVVPTVSEPVKPVESTLALPKPPAVPAVGKPGETPAAVVDRPKPVESPLREPEKNTFSIPTNPPVQTSGDNTMIPLSRSAAAAVLGGMLLTPATPVQAVAPVVPAPSTAIKSVAPILADDRTEVADLKKQLEESNRKLATIQDQLKTLTELLNGKKEADGTPYPIPGLLGQMTQLKDRLAQIEKDLAAFKSQQTSSLRPSNPVTAPANPIVDSKVGKGTIRVVNEYPVQISIVVNGTSYRVAPSKALDVDVPQGEFSYQLLESGGAVTKSAIKEKETVTLRIK